MANQVTCLIPFYNEQKSLEKTLRKIASVKLISQIILINDGSTDNWEPLIKPYLSSRIKLLSLQKNQGKSAAIRHGLKKVITEYVLLLDADLVNLKQKEIKKAVSITKSKQLDMLIFRRVNTNFFMRIFSGDFLFSGERIIKTKQLQKILKQKTIVGFQLESAINQVMFKKIYQIGWLKFSGVSAFKVSKRGFINGLLTEMLMVISIIKYSGLKGYLKQYLYSFTLKQYL